MFIQFSSRAAALEPGKVSAIRRNVSSGAATVFGRRAESGECSLRYYGFLAPAPVYESILPENRRRSKRSKEFLGASPGLLEGIAGKPKPADHGLHRGRG
jgi:hypothetical protein